MSIVLGKGFFFIDLTFEIFNERESIIEFFERIFLRNIVEKKGREGMRVGQRDLVKLHKSTTGRFEVNHDTNLTVKGVIWFIRKVRSAIIFRV